jgi:hypothetical protein
MPCSLVQTMYLPDRDHLIVPIAPSPECRIVSFPVFEPIPIALSQLDAEAAVPPTVVDVALVPDLPPTVRMRLPANPPDKYVLSLLNSGDRATACTGRAKFRSCTSLGSTSDATQTLPSMEEVAMCMELDGVTGTGGCRGLLLDGEAVGGGLLDGLWASEAVLMATSGLLLKGGGLGEIDIAATEAECA